jgi:hypothetical protein
MTTPTPPAPLRWCFFRDGLTVGPDGQNYLPPKTRVWPQHLGYADMVDEMFRRLLEEHPEAWLGFVEGGLLTGSPAPVAWDPEIQSQIVYLAKHANRWPGTWAYRTVAVSAISPARCPRAPAYFRSLGRAFHDSHDPFLFLRNGDEVRLIAGTCGHEKLAWCVTSSDVHAAWLVDQSFELRGTEVPKLMAWGPESALFGLDGPPFMGLIGTAEAVAPALAFLGANAAPNEESEEADEARERDVAHAVHCLVESCDATCGWAVDALLAIPQRYGFSSTERAQALGKIGTPEAVAWLMEQAPEDARALEALAGISSPTVVAALASWASDRGRAGDVRARVAHCLLEHPLVNPAEREAALEALRDRFERLTGDDAHERWSTALALAEAPRTPPLDPALGGGESPRWRLAVSLGMARSAEPVEPPGSLVEDLRRLLQEDDPVVRSMAAELALVCLDEASLRAVIVDSSMAVRSALARDLPKPSAWALTPPPRSPSLYGARHASTPTRWDAAIDILLEDPLPELRAAGAELLLLIDRPPFARLARATRHPDEDVRLAVVGILARMPVLPGPIVDALLADPSAKVRRRLKAIHAVRDYRRSSRAARDPA